MGLNDRIRVVGFDAVSTGSEESQEALARLPIAIIGSLAIATGVWLLLGLVIYALYGYRHSRMRRGA